MSFKILQIELTCLIIPVGSRSLIISINTKWNWNSAQAQNFHLKTFSTRQVAKTNEPRINSSDIICLKNKVKQHPKKQSFRSSSDLNPVLNGKNVETKKKLQTFFPEKPGIRRALQPRSKNSVSNQHIWKLCYAEVFKLTSYKTINIYDYDHLLDKKNYFWWVTWSNEKRVWEMSCFGKAASPFKMNKLADKATFEYYVTP